VSDLPAGELDAVDAALLPRAHADHLPVLGVAHRVGLRVLDGDGGQHQVADRLVTQRQLGHHLQGCRRGKNIREDQWITVKICDDSRKRKSVMAKGR
jgi:hypothetical protein